MRRKVNLKHKKKFILDLPKGPDIVTDFWQAVAHFGIPLRKGYSRL